MVKTNIEISELDDLVKSFKLTKKEMNRFNTMLKERLPKSILKMLVKITPKDTGQTAKSWKSQSIDNGFKITNNRGGIIEFLITGVAPHIIEPKDKSVLMFKLQSSLIFTKIVNHPGYGPQINQDELDNKLIKLVTEETDKIVTKILKKGLKS